ncbi:hypothetical protein H2201_002590 [Coniosporium apollinis]|uniref:Zinc finger RING-type eukaryotic domain-containing protein n=1 Tax=Coniosporium apollinis TaxID=61459 RepID=A0ABQ9NYD8_9PEZI|nr:hypothetical protein H2201_002590 [Coniosporium apollinis]
MITYSDEEEFWSQTGSYDPDQIPADDRNCPICGEAYEELDNDPNVMAVGLQCSHFACLNCLNHWLQTTIRGQVTPDYTSDFADENGSTDEGEDSNSESSSENDNEMPDVEDSDSDNGENMTGHPSLDIALLREEHRWLAQYMRDEELPVWSFEPYAIRSRARGTLRRAAIRIISQEVTWTVHRLHGFETTARRMYQRLAQLVRCNAVVTMYGLAENAGEPQWQVNDLSHLSREARRWIRNIVHTQMNPDTPHRPGPALEYP